MKKNMFTDINNFDNLYTKLEERYIFASKFCSGLTLDYNLFNVMSYHGSKILLKNANEVITCNNTTISSRKYDSNSNMMYSLLDGNLVLKPNTFDFIIYSELLENEHNPDQKVKFLHKLLKKNGMLLITIRNNSNNFFDNSISVVNPLTKNEFSKLLENYFPKFDLYSQKLNTTNKFNKKISSTSFHFKTKLRFFLSTLLLKIDPKSNFYNNFIKTKIRKTNVENSDISTSTKVSISDYIPVSYTDNDNPLYFIALCRKTYDL